MGGGGFSMEPENPLLDNYILQQSKQSTPKICFVGTASGDAEAYIDEFYKAFETKKCIPSHLNLFKNIPTDIEKFLLNQDIIYVGGGNTRNLLLLWEAWGLNEIFKKAYLKGIILSGLSAGAICWFEQGLTDSFPNEICALNGLSFLKGSYCSHFDGDKERQEIYKNKIKNKEIKNGFACDDGVALHFINGNLHQIISSRNKAKAYNFKLKENKLIETEHTPIYLGGFNSTNQ